MIPSLRIIATWSDGTLSAAPHEYALLPHVKPGDILVVMAPSREILFDLHGTDIGYVETCLGPVEVVDVLSVGAVVLRPVWPGATEGDLDLMVGGEVRGV